MATRSLPRRKAQFVTSPVEASPATLKRLERAVYKARDAYAVANTALLRTRGDIHPAYRNGNIQTDEALALTARMRDRDMLRAVVSTKTGGVPRNPLASAGEPIETVHNVRSVIDFLRSSPLEEDYQTDKGAEYGRYLLLNLLRDALEYVEEEARAEHEYNEYKAKKAEKAVQS